MHNDVSETHFLVGQIEALNDGHSIHPSRIPTIDHWYQEKARAGNADLSLVQQALNRLLRPQPTTHK